MTEVSSFSAHDTKRFFNRIAFQKSDSSSFNLDSLVPVLVSPRKGQIVVDDKDLKKYKVGLEFVSDSKSKKINIFQYKNKTGNRRRVGYRENAKIVKVVSIQGLESAEEE